MNFRSTMNNMQRAGRLVCSVYYSNPNNTFNLNVLPPQGVAPGTLPISNLINNNPSKMYQLNGI